MKDICILCWTKIDEFYDAYYFSTEIETIHKIRKFIHLHYNINFYKL